MYPVQPHISETAFIKSMEEYEALYRESIEHPVEFWRKQAELLTWFEEPRSIRNVDMHEVDFSFFEGGKLNASYNCVDRHCETNPDKTAIIWVADEPGEYHYITYRELKQRVGRIANVLKTYGVKRGDRFTRWSSPDSRPRRCVTESSTLAARWSSPPTRACVVRARFP